jgi:arsenate reductase (thioredoxin)
MPGGAVAPARAVPATRSPRISRSWRTQLPARRGGPTGQYGSNIDGFNRATGFVADLARCSHTSGGKQPMPDRVLSVLFLCTGNSARSIIAEALLNQLGGGRFRTHSAGYRPKGEINPYAAQVLRNMGFNPARFHPKSWNEFARPGGPHLDFIFTLYEDAPLEPWPDWAGYPMTAHWGMPDPSQARGTPAEIGAAYDAAARVLARRIEAFAALPFETLDAFRLHSKLVAIGRLEESPLDSTRTHTKAPG